MVRSTRRVYSIAKKAARSVINQTAEVKFVQNVAQANLNLNGLNGTAAPTYGLSRFVTPDQGVDNDERVGDVIRVKSLQLKFTYLGNAANRFLRVVVFMWKDSITAPATLDIAEVLWPLISQQITNITMIYNKEFGHKYTILADRTYATGSGTTIQDHIFIKNIPKQYKNVELVGNTTYKPSFWYVMFSSDTIAAPGAVGIVERLNYTDV